MPKKSYPYLPLMHEHRIIERFLKAINNEVKMMRYKKELNPAFVEMSVTFLSMFADKCHHGKEEGILFKALQGKKLNYRHKETMELLIGEHQFARQLTSAVSDAKRRYIKGDKKALSVIIECIDHLVDMYPGHIYREDNEFFVPVMKYFSDDELKKMVEAEKEFDKDFQHQKYELLVTKMEKILMK